MRFNLCKLGALLAFGFLLTNCTSNTKTNADGTHRLTLAVIPKGTSHSYWKAVHAGAEAAAKVLDVDIIWQGPQKEDDRQQQIQVVQNFISRGVDGIVLAPLDDRSLVQPVRSAVKRNIPVVVIDSDLQGTDFSSFVATDNYEGGKMCANRLAEVLGGKGKIVMLRYQEGSASTLKREQGFIETIKASFPKIEILSDNQYAGATIEKAYQSSQNLLNRFPQAQGAFCPNESTVQGMLRALQTSNKAGHVKLVGFDSSDALIKAIKKGEIQGLALQNPYMMGYLGVETLVKAIRKQQFLPKVNTGVVLVDANNLEKPEIKKLY